MKSNIIKSIRVTLAFCVLLSVSYIFVLWVFAQVASPNGGNAEVVTLDGRVVGAVQIGQAFTGETYFWGRPSAVDFTADASGGSNHGPSNPEHLQQVEERIVAFLAAHPYLKRAEVPAEIVTASASGLDPHISPRAAYAQVQRVATARGLSVERVTAILQENIEAPVLGLFGPEKVNVLKVNVALDEAKK